MSFEISFSTLKSSRRLCSKLWKKWCYRSFCHFHNFYRVSSKHADPMSNFLVKSFLHVSNKDLIKRYLINNIYDLWYQVFHELKFYYLTIDMKSSIFQQTYAWFISFVKLQIIKQLFWLIGEQGRSFHST